MRRLPQFTLLVATMIVATAAFADDSKRLRIISWADYVPADVMAEFQDSSVMSAA